MMMIFRFLYCLFLSITGIIHASNLTAMYSKFPDKEELITRYNLAGKYNPSTHKIIKKHVSIDTVKAKFPNIKVNEGIEYGFVIIYKFEDTFQPRLGGGVLTILCNLITGEILECSRSR